MNDNSGMMIGSAAVDFTLPASTGGEIALSDYRTRQNVYLFFVRAFNWMQCRSHAAQLGRLYENFKRHNVEIVLILGEPIDKAKRYSEILRLPFPVLADPDHKIYHQYGLEKILLIQRTASLIIDCDGIVRYLKAATNPMLWLKESQEILNFVQSLAVACW